MHGTSKFVFVGARWEQQWLLGGSLLGTWEENSSLCVPGVISAGSVALLSPFPLFPFEGGWLFLGHRGSSSGRLCRNCCAPR